MDINQVNETKPYLKDLIELRQIKSERESILRTNQYYIAQVSQMEIKISELKASLQAKDSEIAYLNHRLQEFEENAENEPKSNKLFEDQIIILQAENEHLKTQLKEAGDIAQLKIQLEYALKMKETFEEKYREAKTVLLTNKSVSQFDNMSESEVSVSSQFMRKENQSRAQEEMDILKKQLSQYQTQCSLLSSENDELLKKMDTNEREPLLTKEKPEPPKFKTPVSKPVVSPDPYKVIISSYSTNSSEPSRLSRPTDSLSMKSSSCASLPKMSKLNTSRAPKSSMLPTPKSVIKTEVAEYCPSFMRNKRSDFKTTPTPGVKKNSTNSFANEFPEEDEF
ncbi:hypothetical protein SteCoe_37796 [Stentor coeruleus]|uniref:Uncharacterized protein n=1 Tax=Stentor coeruleus TaxID=5963 RepID=A0A1R2AMC4_9CILI|nr:hypothetical protein SteCoe_37796 [Stentor coeruleus]